MFHLWRGLINQRPAKPISEQYLKLEDAFLKSYYESIALYSIKNCYQTNYKNCYLFKGDVIQLQVESVVNAANSDLLGCFIPNHTCIDNTLHTFSGFRLRLYCKQLMLNQKMKEGAGKAKLTPAFQLPADYILHTVGPGVSPNGKVTEIRKVLLAKAYQSCLEKAFENQIHEIAFPCISTGEFGFSSEIASEIAIKTVLNWLEGHQEMKVIFVLYTDTDWELYRKN